MAQPRRCAPAGSKARAPVGRRGHTPMSPRSLLVLALLPLLLCAFTPGAAASVPVGACVQQDHNSCPGFVCVYVEAKYVCETPGTVGLPTLGTCTEFARNCPAGELVCGVVNGSKYYCVPDICYDAPEWCNPTLA